MATQQIARHSLWLNNKTQKVYVVEGVLPDYTNAREGQNVVLYYQAENLKIRGVREESEFLIKFTPHQVTPSTLRS